MTTRHKRRMWVLALCLASFLLSSWSYFQHESDTGTLFVDGAERTYHFRVPRSGLQPGAPAIVALHGSESNGLGMRTCTRWGAVADRHGILMVYPDAGKGRDSWDLGWVDAHPDARDNPDVAFLRALLRELPDRFDVNPRRIYMCGMSTGAVMTGRMAGEAADLLAAVGIVSGTVGRRVRGRTVAPPRPEVPVPVLTIHGALDPGMPLDGGTDRELWSLAACADFWRRADGIQATEPESTRGDGWVRQRWTGASRRSEVVLLTLEREGHGWPLRTTEELWSFFERHALP